MTESRGSGDSGRLVHLRFKPLWLYVDAVREFCGFFARATFEDVRLGDRVGLVVHELIENAIKYGDDQELELHIERAENEVTVRVTNTASEEKAGLLRRSFDALMQRPPQEAYSEALKNAASLPSSQSKLGLPRIRFEGQVELELDVLPGRVSIIARGAA